MSIIFRKSIFLVVLIFIVYHVKAQKEEKKKYFRGFNFKDCYGINETHPFMINGFPANDFLERELFIVKSFNDTIKNIIYHGVEFTPIGNSRYSLNYLGWGCEFAETLTFYDDRVIHSVDEGCCEKKTGYFNENLLLTKVEYYQDDKLNKENIITYHIYDDTLGIGDALNDVFYLRGYLPEVSPAQLRRFFQDSLTTKELIVVHEVWEYEGLNRESLSEKKNFVKVDVDTLIQMIQDNKLEETKFMKIRKDHYLFSYRIRSNDQFMMFIYGLDTIFPFKREYAMTTPFLLKKRVHHVNIENYVPDYADFSDEGWEDGWGK